MSKYKADIFPHGGGSSHVAYVESDDQWAAEALLKLQYPNCYIRWLQEVAPASGSPDATDAPAGPTSLREYALAILLLAIGIPAYQWVKGTFFDDARPEQVAADVIEAPPASTAPTPSVAPEPKQIDPVTGTPEGDMREVTTAHGQSVVEAQPAAAEPIKLATFRVVVEAADGAQAELMVSARDEAHALQIVRDFRGNPAVIRVEQL